MHFILGQVRSIEKKKNNRKIQARWIREILRRRVWILDVSFSLGNFVLTSYRP